MYKVIQTLKNMEEKKKITKGASDVKNAPASAS